MIRRTNLRDILSVLMVFLFILSSVYASEYTSLTSDEINGLIKMREEEKLARDVYQALFDKWKQQIFSNIASSEQTHTDAVKSLLDSYGIEDPVKSDKRGAFTNGEFTKLYNALVEEGQKSLINALTVGATIEDLDIKDLNELLEKTQNKDIKLVYENLRKGSRNHLRSFNKQLVSNGRESYKAKYLSQEEVDAILAGNQEKGQILDENSNIVLGNHKSGKGNNRGKNFQGNVKATNSKRINGFSFKCKGCEASDQNGKTLRVRATNGKEIEVRVTPETASKKALKKLGLNSCKEDNSCEMELKTIQKGKETKAVYEIKATKKARLFGLFRVRMQVRAQVDADKGEIVEVSKPWWSFLASSAE